MDKNIPLVSIVLPVFNAGEFLHDSLKSLTSQTHKNIEIVVIDDNSKDNSFSILKDFRKKDKRIRIFKNIKRYGLSISLNRALKRAKGEYIAFMDSNGISMPNRIQKQIIFLQENPKIAALGSQYSLINSKGKKKEKSKLPKDHQSIYHGLPLGLSVKFETLMLNKKTLPKDLLKFPSKFYTFLASERHMLYTEMLLKILPYGEFSNLSECLYHERIESIPQKTLSLFTVAKLWLKSIMMYDHRPSLRSILETTIIATNN